MTHKPTRCIPLQPHIEFSPEHQSSPPCVTSHNDKCSRWIELEVDSSFLIKTAQSSTASDPHNLCENGSGNFHFSNWCECEFNHLLNPKFLLPNRGKTPRGSKHSPQNSPVPRETHIATDLQLGCPGPGASHTEQYHITRDGHGGERNESETRRDVNGEDPNVLALLHLGDRDPTSSATAAAPSTAAVCEAGSTSRRFRLWALSHATSPLVCGFATACALERIEMPVDAEHAVGVDVIEEKFWLLGADTWTRPGVFCSSQKTGFPSVRPASSLNNQHILFLKKKNTFCDAALKQSYTETWPSCESLLGCSMKVNLLKMQDLSSF